MACFCGDPQTNGRGLFTTIAIRTKPRPVRATTWAMWRTLSGFLETCETCGDNLSMNYDGEVLRVLKSTDKIIAN